MPPRLPALPNTHLAASETYGPSRASRPAGPASAQAAKVAESFLPTRGSLPTHSGGCGKPESATLFARSRTSSACSAMVPIAAHRGITSRSSMPSVISATAGARRFPSRACRDFSIGQVATTSIVAQTAAARNGRRTHSEPAISSRMQMTARVMRARSWRMALIGKCSACGRGGAGGS